MPSPSTPTAAMLFSASTSVRASVRFTATRIPRRNSRRDERAKPSCSYSSARNALITLIPSRISIRRPVTSANSRWRRCALRRIRRPKIEIVAKMPGPTTTITSESCHDTNSSDAAPTTSITAASAKSSNTSASAPCAVPTSPISRASRSPRLRSRWKRSGSANSLPQSSIFMSRSIRPSTHATR